MIFQSSRLITYMMALHSKFISKFRGSNTDILVILIDSVLQKGGQYKPPPSPDPPGSATDYTWVFKNI